MPFDPKEFEPVPNDWFATNIDYEGWGRAEFSDPSGSLEGPVSIRFDELGEANFEMTPDLRANRHIGRCLLHSKVKQTSEVETHAKEI